VYVCMHMCESSILGEADMQGWLECAYIKNVHTHMDSVLCVEHVAMVPW